MPATQNTTRPNDAFGMSQPPAILLDENPRHLVLAIHCLAEARQPSRLAVRGRAAARALIEMLRVARTEQSRNNVDAVTHALHETVLPILALMGPDWAGAPVYRDWYTVHGHLVIGPALRGSRSARVLAAPMNAALQNGPPAIPEQPGEPLSGMSDPQAAILQAAEAMAAHRSDPGELRRLAVESPQRTSRAAAIRSRVEYWRDDPGTQNLLWHLTNDPDPSVRLTVLQAIVGRWPDDPTTQTLVLRCCTHDLSRQVRLFAIGTIANKWRDDPTAYAMLIGLARTIDQVDEPTRLAAVSALCSGWPERPDVQRTAGGLRLIAARGRDRAPMSVTDGVAGYGAAYADVHGRRTRTYVVMHPAAAKVVPVSWMPAAGR